MFDIDSVGAIVVVAFLGFVGPFDKYDVVRDPCRIHDRLASALLYRTFTRSRSSAMP